MNEEDDVDVPTFNDTLARLENIGTVQCTLCYLEPLHFQKAQLTRITQDISSLKMIVFLTTGLSTGLALSQKEKLFINLVQKRVNAPLKDTKFVYVRYDISVHIVFIYCIYSALLNKCYTTIIPLVFCV